MTGDFLLVGAVLCGLFAIPSFISSFSDRRRPILAGGLALVSAIFAAWAVRVSPEGLTFEEIPLAFIRVIAVILN